MARRDDDKWRVVAGEYVLGTLRGRARRRFERLRDRDAYYCDMADEWERRLAPLVDALPETEPPPEVWRRVERRIGEPSVRPARAGLWHRLGFWRPFGLAAAAVAACLLVVVAVQQLAPAPEAGSVAVLGDGQTAGAYLVTVDAGGGRLEVRRLRPISVPAGRRLELWLVRGGATPPRSLGLLPTQDTGSLALPADVRQAVQPGLALAVSVEPEGGSPTGAPTGPVVLQGRVYAVR